MLVLVMHDALGAYCVLEQERQGGAYRPGDVWGSTLFTLLYVLQIMMCSLGDEENGSSAWIGWWTVLPEASEELGFGDQNARRPDATDELVRGNEDGVLVGE